MGPKLFTKFFIFTLIVFELIIIYLLRNLVLSLFPYFATIPNTYDSYVINFILALILALMQTTNNYILSLQDKIIKQAIHKCIFIIGRTKISDVNSTLRKMCSFINSSKVRWGVTLNTDVLKIANSAEGLIALAKAYEYGILFSDDLKKEIISVADRLLAEYNEFGYKSYNVNEYTVHCTAMVLFVIKKLSDVNLYSISDENYEKLRDASKTLLYNISKYGWGFYNKKNEDPDLIRIFSTIWALRALNILGFSNNKKFIGAIEEIFEAFSNGLIGFSIKSEPKTAITSFMLLLNDEITDKKCKSQLEKIMDDQILNNMICFIFSQINKEVEVEEFLLDKYSFQKLSWSHISIGINVEALSLYTDKMSKLQYLKLNRILLKLNKNIDDKRGYFFTSELDFKHNDPLLYPTTYIITAFCEFLKYHSYEYK